MATKKISELEAITEADDSDVLAIVDVSEGKTNKITKNNLLIGAGHSIEMSLNQETYALTLTLKNAAGTELSRASIDLPNENSITDISYNNGKLTLTKQSGTTTEVDITGLINGLATETALTNLANALKETIGIQTNTYDNTKTYNTGDIVVQNEKIYKANQDNITGTFDSSKWDEISLYEYQKLQDEAIEENYKVITKLQEDVEDLTERVEDAENNELTSTPTPATSHYLQDSADARFRKFIPIGRTTQESTTGKNLLPVEEILTFTTFKNINVNIPAGTYKVTCSSLTSQGTDGVVAAFGTNVVWLSSTQEKNVTLQNDITEITIYSNGYSYDNSQGKSATIKQLMVSVSGGAYEPYTGGEPAPNPKYPYAIKNTGDNVNEIASFIQPSYNRYEDILDAEIPNINDLLGQKITISFMSDKVGTIYENGNVFTTSETRNIVVGRNSFTFTFKNEIPVNSDTYSNGKLRLLKNSVTTNTCVFTEVKLEQGTHATPYSPYGCGNVNEKVTNANIWDEEWELGGINNSNGENYVSTSLIRSKNYIPVNPNTQLYIKNGTDYAWFYAYDKDKNFIGYAFGSSSSVANEIKTTIANCYYVRFQCRSQYGTTYNNDICINVSNPSINGTYVPHSEQNISFPLAQGQKLMEGDYPDDDEKVHHKMGEVVLDGSDDEGWLMFNSKQSYKLPIANIGGNAKTSIISNVLCNQLRAVNQDSIYLGDVDNGVASLGGTVKAIYVRFDETITSVNLLRQKLAENPITVQYELAEEQTEDFTEEQKTAWEEWKKARTYKNVTHISSEDETPANVEIEYVQDTKTYIDNKVTALTNAIISLGGNV